MQENEAPNSLLKLVDHDKVNHEFNLNEAYSKGPTLLYFFPAAFTGVCTKSSCQMRDELAEYAQNNIQIFGLSTDSPFTLKKFREENNLNYPLLSDWNRDAIEKFGIVDNNFAGGLKGIAKRSLFLIKDGKIAYSWIASSPGEYPPYDELKKQF